MIEDNDIWTYEKAYLERVMLEINKQINIGLNAARNYKSDAVELQKSMWEDVRLAPSGLSDLEDVAQMNQIQMELANKARLYRFSYEKVDHLKSMKKSPYFGRIDFLENVEKIAEKIYIGLYNLNSTDTMDILVYDWRAPVSGMFYDFEIGPSSYTCPAGLIKGQILLKRQYKIENENIVYMFDSSININDAMLQEILGKNTDNRMRTIVTSIQKEQNTVIRNDKDSILIVEGPAGSGKTSIALHRAAYLLYRYRDTIKSENILIFSPNHVFEDYISHVLPELGEENIRRSTFADFFSDSFLAGRHIETVNQQMEYILTSDDTNNIRFGCIRFKSSALFMVALKRYVEYLEEGTELKFKDLIFKNSLLISAEAIMQLYNNQSSRLPYANRLEKIRQKLLSILQENIKKRARYSKKGASDENYNMIQQELNTEYELIKNDIIKMTAFDVISLYINLFKSIRLFVPTTDKKDAASYSRFAHYTIKELERGIVNYEDLAPLVYLKAALEAENYAGSIKHIIIDEAQDYTALHYEIFKTIFKNCKITILGDVNQTVNGYMSIGSFDIISDILASDSKKITLTKSYRSSKELADFCNSLLITPNNSEQLDRHGVKPKLVKVSTRAFYQKLTEDINILKSKGYKLIAVICKTASECKAVYQYLNASIDIGLISNQNEVYYGDVVVIPSYLAKGLEFDAVLVNSIENKDYYNLADRQLLYTVCTRALHELYLYYFDVMSGFVSGVDNNLYTAEYVSDKDGI